MELLNIKYLMGCKDNHILLPMGHDTNALIVNAFKGLWCINSDKMFVHLGKLRYGII